MFWTLQLVGLTTVVAVGVINGGRVALAVAVAEAVALAEGSGLADGSAAAGVGVSGVPVGSGVPEAVPAGWVAVQPPG